MRFNTGFPLTPAELETLRLVACGMTNPGIAETRCTAQGTVNQTIHHIYNRLGLNTRTQVTLYALRHGIVTLDEACAVAGIGEGAG